MQKPLSAIWNFHLKLSFLSGSYINVQLFHCNHTEKDLCIAIRAKMTEPKHRSLIKMLILDEKFRRHLEAFGSELSYIYIYIYIYMKSSFAKTDNC